eukprot:m.262249 g.262249  ORF g.262249 m.262249 type:complete len:430 (-) comp15588_c0_seq3:3497-4786(-)
MSGTPSESQQQAAFMLNALVRSRPNRNSMFVGDLLAMCHEQVPQQLRLKLVPLLTNPNVTAHQMLRALNLLLCSQQNLSFTKEAAHHCCHLMQYWLVPTILELPDDIKLIPVAIHACRLLSETLAQYFAACSAEEASIFLNPFSQLIGNLLKVGDTLNTNQPLNGGDDADTVLPYSVDDLIDCAAHCMRRFATVVVTFASAEGFAANAVFKAFQQTLKGVPAAEATKQLQAKQVEIQSQRSAVPVHFKESILQAHEHFLIFKKLVQQYPALTRAASQMLQQVAVSAKGTPAQHEVLANVTQVLEKIVLPVVDAQASKQSLDHDLASLLGPPVVLCSLSDKVLGVCTHRVLPLLAANLETVEDVATDVRWPLLCQIVEHAIKSSLTDRKLKYELVEMVWGSRSVPEEMKPVLAPLRVRDGLRRAFQAQQL